MRILTLFTFATLLAGCAADGDDGDERARDPEELSEDMSAITFSCNDQLPAVDVNAQMFLFYGTYRPTASAPPAANSMQTLSMLKGGSGEHVLSLRRAASTCVALDSDVAAWRQGGGLIAHTMTIEELASLIDRGIAADRIEQFLRSGYAYVAIDELARDSLDWRNGGAKATAMRAVFDTLAARGLDRRIILYVNSYNMKGAFGSYATILAAFRDHGRMVASEIYLDTSHVLASASGTTYAESTGRCNRNLSCLQTLAYEMRNAAPGINHRTITVLGVSDEYNQGRIDSLCGEPGKRGALYYQYARLHAGELTHLQPGIAAYTLVRVIRTDHPSWGPIDQADCLNRLNSWTGWPRAQ